ncbi:MAG TPA: YtxH domain-containing protein [Actinomadura sp.]|jgi:hypothetical protein|nr:YtxH domain-containing protein [Actinomadura sp.]
MRYRATFVAGAAVGYLLGTRAGRERYEEIRRLARRVAESPTAQEVAGLVRAQAGAMACTARVKVTGTLQNVFGDRIPGVCRSDDRGVPRSTETTSTYH